MLTFFYATILILFFSFLFLCLGLSLLLKSNFLKKSEDLYYIFGASFYLGLTLFLFGWSSATHLLGDNVRLGLLVSLMATLLILYQSKTETGSYFIKNLKKISLVIIIVTLFSIIGLGRSLVPIPTEYLNENYDLNPFASLSAVSHSLRPGNLAIYITEENRLPILNQNSGQAMLAALPSLMGIETPQLSMVLWLNIFLAMFTILIYGLVRQKFGVKRFAFLPLIIVLLGNTVLSPFYTSITDTDSALFLTGNTDSLFSIATLLLFIVFLFSYFTNLERPSFYQLGILFILGYVWNLTGGQTTLLAFSVILFSLIKTVPPFRPQTKKQRGVQFGVVLILGAIAGAFIHGGMLLPSRYAEEITLPGIMTVRKPDHSFLSLRFPRTNEANPKTWTKLKEIYQEPVDKPNQTETKRIETIAKKNPLIFSIARIVRSGQVIFFPLLGLLSAFYLFKRNRLSDKDDAFAGFFLYHSAILFLIGWLASTFFVLYGYYWELSRFLYFGSFATMFFLGLALARLLEENFKNKTKRFCLIALTAFILIGPTLHYFGVGLIGNLLTPGDQQTLSLQERFFNLIDFNRLVG